MPEVWTELNLVLVNFKKRAACWTAEGQRRAGCWPLSPDGTVAQHQGSSITFRSAGTVTICLNRQAVHSNLKFQILLNWAETRLMGVCPVSLRHSQTKSDQVLWLNLNVQYINSTATAKQSLKMPHVFSLLSQFFPPFFEIHCIRF